VTTPGAAAEALAALVNAPLAALALDDGRIVGATAGAAQALGHPRPALVGRTLADLAAPDDRHLLAPLAAGAPLPLPVAVGTVSADGAPRTLTLAGGPTVVVVELARPVVYWESDPAEPSLGANPLRGVDGALSHDVRGALRGVKSFLELVERSDALAADEKASRFLAIARGAGADADTMVERLVHLLRIHDRPAAVEPLDLTALLGDARRSADDPAAALDVRVDDDLPHVVGNAELLVEVLAELLTNAAKFGASTVDVSARSEGAWVWIAVADDGPGIPEELREDAFRLFRLLQPKGRVPGVGMGLPIGRAIATAHGGSLVLEGREGGGTVAVLRLVAAGGERGRDG